MGLVGRRFGAIAGLAAICILAGSFLVVVISRNSGAGPGAGSTTPPTGAEWRSSHVKADLGFGPQLAASGSRLFLIEEDAGHTTHVWSSSDAAAWQEAADPGIDGFFVPRAAIGDGSGGLLVAGELTPTEQTVPQIWRSADGRTFTKGAVESLAAGASGTAASGIGGAEIVSVATASGHFVAFGDHNFIDPSSSNAFYALDVWYSGDGSNWSHSTLPDSTDFMATALTAWKGGFAAIGSANSGKASAVWLSSDGAEWHKSGAVDTFGAASIAGLGDRLVVLGAKLNSALGMVPASWSSTDGQRWSEALAPVDGYGSMFDSAVVVGNQLVAIGQSHIGTAVAAGDSSAGPSLQFKIVPPTAWVTTDGVNWSRASSVPPYEPYQSSLAAFDGHPVLATLGIKELTVSVGSLP
jgi:hypothetical protein